MERVDLLIVGGGAAGMAAALAAEQAGVKRILLADGRGGWAESFPSAFTMDSDWDILKRT